MKWGVLNVTVFWQQEVLVEPRDHPLCPLHYDEVHETDRLVRCVWACQCIHGKSGQLPYQFKHMELGAASVTHEGFQVQIHRDVFGRCNWYPDGAGKVVSAGVDHVAFTRKNSLCKNEYCPDDCIIGSGNA